MSGAPLRRALSGRAFGWSEVFLSLLVDDGDACPLAGVAVSSQAKLAGAERALAASLCGVDDHCAVVIIVHLRGDGDFDPAVGVAWPPDNQVVAHLNCVGGDRVILEGVYPRRRLHVNSFGRGTMVKLYNKNTHLHRFRRVFTGDTIILLLARQVCRSL